MLFGHENFPECWEFPENRHLWVTYNTQVPVTGGKTPSVSCVPGVGASSADLAKASASCRSSPSIFCSPVWFRRACSGKSDSDRNGVWVPVVPITSLLFFKSKQHWKRQTNRELPWIPHRHSCHGYHTDTVGHGYCTDAHDYGRQHTCNMCRWSIDFWS